MTTTNRKKIAILGGGMAALAAAFELTRRPELAEAHEITVYQMGHRLGGKGASGRNAEEAHRIEEHGLHILMGFYENAFDILRACYAELGRAPGEPLSTIDEAFEPHDYIVVTEKEGDGWKNWPVPFPRHPGAPGDGGGTLPSLADCLREIVRWMGELFAGSPALRDLAPRFQQGLQEVDQYLETKTQRPRTRGGRTAAVSPDPEAQQRALEDAVDQMMSAPRGPKRRSGGPSFPDFTLLDVARRILVPGASDPWQRISWLVDRFRSWLEKKVEERLAGNDTLRRLWIQLDLGITAIKGIIADRLLLAPDDYFALDGEDFQAWLKRHGASEIAWSSALVRALYNLGFSQPGEIAAGTALHGIFRMAITYRGSIFYRMAAGMGDAVFAPLYLVLKKRGVRFCFFHRVDDIVVSPDGKRVVAVEMGRQVTVKGGEYDPLYDVRGLPCWPTRPRYEQLEEGEALRRSGENLESWWTSWKDAGQVRIEEGKHFDTVILGISAGALSEVGRQLVEANPRFAAMVDALKTAQSQASQLWLGSSFEKMGWELPPPVLDGFAEPFDTWADMTHLLPREVWPKKGGPVALAYLCGRLPDEEAPPSRGASDYPDRQRERARQNVAQWLETEARGLWPAAGGDKGGFDWSLLHDAGSRRGRDRLEGQYTQATYSPSERYVLSVPGSSKLRLRADESGFERLVLAGDWVLTAMSAGCIEAATMAGKQAARAICGYPAVIAGDLPPSPRAMPSPVRELRPAPAELPAIAALTMPSPRPAYVGQLPAYVERGGDVVIRHPLTMTGTTSYSFLLPADEGALQQLCDRLLNGPARGAARYVPLGPLVMLVCADITRGQARDTPDHDKGWLGERDVAFWVPLLAGQGTGDGFVPDRLVWMLTYTFVDNVAAVVTGREIFGFPKEQATLVYPTDPGSGGRFTVDTLVIRRFTPESRAEIARIVTAQPLGQGRKVGPSRAPLGLSSIERGLRDLGDRIGKALQQMTAPINQAITGYLDSSLRLVFLKQFRDVRDPARACYQAVVEADTTVDAFHSGDLLPPHLVTIEPADSHPIVAELGLPGPVVQSIAAFRLSYDFTVQKGAVISGG